MEIRKKVLLIDFCNYEDYPIGGYLTFAKNMMLTFSNDLALIGITTDKNDPVSKWFKKIINGIEYDFFALARYDKLKSKHRIPDRLAIFILLKLNKNKILSINLQNVFIQRAEILIAIKNFRFRNIAYRFAGLENPLQISKYWYSRFIANFFDKKFFTSFKNVNAIFAAGNDQEINKMVTRSKGIIKTHSIIQFPTRIDSKVFKKLDKTDSRHILGVIDSHIVITTTGRLAWLKGWKFMIDSFTKFLQLHPKSILYFIGDGEDIEKINVYISSLELNEKIILVGKKSQKEIVLYLNASDIFIMGSFKEGWSTTLVEAVACGVPVCTTNFSSAKEIITEGVTGYVVEHNTALFINKMDKCLSIKANNLPLSSDVNKYSVSTLKEEILKYWELY